METYILVIYVINNGVFTFSVWQENNSLQVTMMYLKYARVTYDGDTICSGNI